MLETLLEVAGMQSFVLAVDPMNPSDMGFLGGTVLGREFWRNMRNGGDSGAKAFKAHCFRGTESSLPPLPIPPRNSSSRAITPSLRGTPAKSTKADLYDAVRKALRTASGVGNAEMKWTNHERLDGYGVRIVGWPADIPATNPSSLKVSQNKTLLECLENGSLRFEKIVSIPEASPAVEISADDILAAEEAASQAVSLNDSEGVQMAEVSMARVTPETEDSLWTLNPNGDGDVGVSNDTDTENIDKDDNDDDDSLKEQPIATHPTDSEDTYWEASANASLIGDLWADLDIGVLLQTESNPSRKRPRSETSPPVDPNAQNLHPVSEAFKENELFGELEPKDTEWTCAGGFVTETQIFYIAADDGKFIILQVIHSAVGLWYPTIQFVFKLYDSKTKDVIWKSVNVTNFTTSPSGLDKRSCKADQFSITYKQNQGSDHPESYTVRANLADDLQLSFDILRPAAVPGWKVGKGPQGGFTYFGPDPKNAEGYAIHRFWPYSKATGTVIRAGKAVTYQGPSMMVQAIQGMRPNLLAAAWNFGNFQSEEHGGVSAIQMEFKTCDTHGRKGNGSGGVWVNIGSLVVGGKLAAVTAQTKWPGEQSSDEGVVSRTTHLNPVHDPDTGYNAPQQILWEWTGPSVTPNAEGTVKAKLALDVGSLEAPKGLIEKVDVLAEIPYVLKMAVNYVAGTKPYIYQWYNPATLSITGPESIATGLSSGLEVSGVVFNEASFISA
ncbi:hypothetical protein H0H93_000987 [Arthromyces matolae]|nr:hypothetical protein H0H93_000987 [Arthromyces matolae]